MENEVSNNINNRNNSNNGQMNVDNSSGGQPRATYTIPGILHFIQHEWARFEMERAHWEVERAELQVYFISIITFYLF